MKRTTMFVITGVLTLIFLIGLYLQVKIIIISKKEKEMMWKIDICHSVIMIIYYAFQILIETITHVIPNLSQFTGSWFCYASQFLTLYGKTSISLHSLHTATHKYIFIVHHETTHRYGIDKAKQVSLWTYLAIPIVMGTPWMLRPGFEAISSVNRCLDSQWKEHPNENNDTAPNSLLEKGEDLILFCGFDDYDGNTSFDYFIHVANQIYCFAQTALAWRVLVNVIDILLYKKLFHYMRR